MRFQSHVAVLSPQPTNTEQHGAVGLELDDGSSGASLATSATSLETAFRVPPAVS